MTRLIWFLAWVGVAFVTVACLSAYGLVDVATQAVTGGADLAPRPPDSFRTGDPHPLEAAFPAIAFVKNLGAGAILTLWAMSTLLILGAAWAVTRVIRIFFADMRPVPRPPSRPGHLPRWTGPR